MDREESFLRTIREDPHGRETRLAYADWLEEYGDPRRAELIRVGEAMRKLPVFSDEYWQLKARRNGLRDRCPADWLAATGYDGSRYDPLYRDGIPPDWKGRWRLTREFTERWHGLAMGDVGGRQEVVRAEESRLGLQFPPSVREYVAYAHDVFPEGGARCVHRDPYMMRPIPDQPALSLMMISEGNVQWAVHYDELDRDDPPIHTYIWADGDETRYVPYPEGDQYPQTVSEFILGVANSYKPEGGRFRATAADGRELNEQLAAAFPIRIEGNGGPTYEGDGILARVQPELYGQGFVLDVCVHQSVTWERIPGFLWDYARKRHMCSGMFLGESDRRGVRDRWGAERPAWLDTTPPPLRDL